jgi:outer membrane protein OmpA-like peptidoglycan-associated protein
MRFKSLLLGSGVALLCAMPANAGHFHGWYIGLEGGANWVSDNDAAFGTFQPPPGPVSIDFDTGWTVLATAGYGFQSNWRVEAELGYRSNDIDAVTGATTRTGGELTATTLMANVLYDWPLSDRWTVSVGAGAGAAHNQFDDGVIDQDGDYNFAYQGIAGISYALSPRMDLTLNYRFTKTDDADFHGPHLAHTDFYDTDGFENQALTIGLRYDLSPDEAPVAAAPPPPPPPVAAPAAPPAPRQFLVFFGFNKSNLTAEAQKVISEAAQAAKETGSATVVVVGHADTVGSQQYNQKLSERRANNVREALVAQGIEAGKITATGKGETELLVQTGDGVKEPQNRRASVDLQ